MGFIWVEYFEDIEISVNDKMTIFENIQKKREKW